MIPGARSCAYLLSPGPSCLPLSHEAPPKAAPNVDLTDAQKILAEQNRQREDKFSDSWFQEMNKEDILAKKFEEAMKKAKDAPAGKPIRDFDLD